MSYEATLHLETTLTRYQGNKRRQAAWPERHDGRNHGSKTDGIVTQQAVVTERKKMIFRTGPERTWCTCHMPATAVQQGFVVLSCVQAQLYE